MAPDTAAKGPAGLLLGTLARMGCAIDACWNVHQWGENVINVLHAPWQLYKRWAHVAPAKARMHIAANARASLAGARQVDVHLFLALHKSVKGTEASMMEQILQAAVWTAHDTAKAAGKDAGCQLRGQPNAGAWHFFWECPAFAAVRANSAFAHMGHQSCGFAPLTGGGGPSASPCF